MIPYVLEEWAELRTLNTFGVAARTRWLAALRSAGAIGELLARPELEGLPVMALGEGSNLLLAGDWPGLMLRFASSRIEVLQEDADSGLLRVEAGVNWDALVDWSLDHGFAGLENLALIPGLAGAAPIQNIGAYGVEIGEFIAGVETWNREQRLFEHLDREGCVFGYRDSVFKRRPERWLVTAVELRLPRRHAPRTGYAGIAEELAAMDVEQPGPREVADAVRRLRRRKLPDPRAIGNAGSFFKNPVVPAEQAEALRAELPALPVFATADPGARKVSAAALIEACGWRGYREGDAGVSAQHALVVVNHGHATGAELLALARRVADSVRERFDVALEPEPRIVGARFEGS
jgi:UDP-N-acetylmuramate dehydrogenase